MLLSQTTSTLKTMTASEEQLPKTIEDLFDMLIDSSILDAIPSTKERQFSSFSMSSTSSTHCLSSSEEYEEDSGLHKGRPRKPCTGVMLDLAMKRERNRLAAEKCRQKKQNLIETLQKECTELKSERDTLLAELQRLRAALASSSSK